MTDPLQELKRDIPLIGFLVILATVFTLSPGTFASLYALVSDQNAGEYRETDDVETRASIAGGTVLTATVDLSKTAGPVTHRASGFLFGMQASQPDISLIEPLKPKLVRMQDQSGYGVELYPRVVQLGATPQMLVSQNFAGYFPAECRYRGQKINGVSCPPWPGDNGDWSWWEDSVETLVRKTQALQQTYEWDIWNEPNFSFFWRRPWTQFLQTWLRTVNTIKSVEPNAVIVGPSLFEFNQSRLQSFLVFAQKNNVLPDVLSWHELNGNGSQIPSHVRAMRAFMANRKIPIQKIEINEMIPNAVQFYPGAAVWYIANIERAGVDGVTHACWPEFNGDTLTNCGNNSLDGLLTYDGSGRRSTWWAYAAYGEMSGNMVTFTRKGGVDGVASYDAGKGEVHLVLGRMAGLSKDSLNLVLKNMSPDMAAGGTVRVIAKHIPNSGKEALSAPTTVIDGSYPVVNGQVTLQLQNFLHKDVYAVTVSKP